MGADMSATLLKELDRELKAFEAESEAVHLKRRERMTARGELETTSADLMDVIRRLDPAPRYFPPERSLPPPSPSSGGVTTKPGRDLTPPRFGLSARNCCAATPASRIR